MLKHLLVIILFICSLNADAQVADSLFVIHKGTGWIVKYQVKQGETPHMLAQRFYITDPVLAYANELESMKSVTPGSIINIPVKPENYFTVRQPLADRQELYYHVVPKDDIALLSTYAGITKNDMREWNNLKGNTLTPGQTLFVGWIKIITYDTSNPASELVYPSAAKPENTAGAPIKAVGGLDTAYDRQTNNGTNVLTEKGTAVFFEKTGKSNIFYAFHNSTPRGSVIKVTNPGTGKSIFVKVLGPIPDTKQYAGSIIGIATAAKEALGVTDTKAWCELSYSPN
jgi:LysM repeat protein